MKMEYNAKKEKMKCNIYLQRGRWYGKECMVVNNIIYTDSHQYNRGRDESGGIFKTQIAHFGEMNCIIHDEMLRDGKKRMGIAYKEKNIRVVSYSAAPTSVGSGGKQFYIEIPSILNKFAENQNYFVSCGRHHKKYFKEDIEIILSKMIKEMERLLSAYGKIKVGAEIVHKSWDVDGTSRYTEKFKNFPYYQIKWEETNYKTLEEINE